MNKNYSLLSFTRGKGLKIGGIGFYLVIALALAKYFKLLTISWLWVFSPIWLAGGIGILGGIIGLLGGLIALIATKHLRG